MSAAEVTAGYPLAEELPLPEKTLADIVARDAYTGILRSLLPDDELDWIFLLDRLQTVCLCGRPGTGKRTLAMAYAGSAGRRGCRILRGSCSALSEDREAAADQMRQILQEAAGSPSVLLLEMGGRRELWEAFSQCRKELSSQAPLTVLLIEDEETFLGSPWLRGMTVLHVQPPESAARAVFFESDENRLMRRTDAQGKKVPSYQWLAEETEGLTYTELQLVVRLIRVQMKRRAQRELDGDPERVIAELKKGLFFYTEDMFSQTVKTVRSCFAAAYSASDGEEGYGSGLQDDKLHRLLAGLRDVTDEGKTSRVPESGETVSNTQEETLSEDEQAWNDIMGRLRIPPKPDV